MDTENSILSPIFDNSATTIVFGVDNGFFIPLVVCIQSIIENSISTHNYDIIILVNKFNSKYKDIIINMAIGHNNISIRVHDISLFLNIYNVKNLKTGKRLSIATYYRLFIPDLMKDYHKVIYIDADTVVLEDISNIFDIDIKDYYAASVKDFNIIKDMSMSFLLYTKNVLCMKNPNVYFNAGVLVLNLDKIRQDFSLKYLIEQAELKGSKHHDQDVLNSLFYGKVKFLPPKYNSMWQDENLYQNTDDGYDAIYQPVIIHYTGGDKPWLKSGASRSSAQYFWKYAFLCPCKDSIIQIYQNDCKIHISKYNHLYRIGLWYNLLSKIFFGRKRRHYLKKYQYIKNDLKVTQRLMQNNSINVPWIAQK